MDVQNYRGSLIGAGKAANTINNRLAAVKAMHHWALDNEMIEHSPKLRAVKKITPQQDEKSTFNISQIVMLLENASTYVQDVSEQTDRVVNNVRKLIVQGDS